MFNSHPENNPDDKPIRLEEAASGIKTPATDPQSKDNTAGKDQLKDKKGMDYIKKFGIPALIAVFGICAALLLVQTITPPPTGKAPEAVEIIENQSEQVSTESLEIRALKRKVKTLDENIKKIYSNQVELNKSIGDLVKNEENSKKTNKENRAYIAMMYQKILDIELQLENVGGGFNVRQKTRAEEINPLIGTDQLPAP